GIGETVPRIAPDIAALDREYVLPTYVRLPLEVVSGLGGEVVGRDGRRYLDFVTGLSVSNFGHCHPRVVAAIREQAGRLIHCSNLYTTEPQARLAGRLSALANGGRVFFSNSGAEANELAVKIARKRARSLGGGVIVTVEGSFHGRTMATLSATGQPLKQKDFGPPLDGFLHVPFGDVAALETSFREHRVAAFMVEPVLGEGGVRIHPDGYLEAAGLLCAQHDALLMVDEVQTGLGRCGAFFAYQRFGLNPDVVTVAKTLAGGLPMGGTVVAGRAEGVIVAGDHGSTFGGGPVVAAAALAVLDLVEGDGLFAAVEDAGARLEGWLRTLEKAGAVREVRRLGLMAAADLTDKSAKQVVLDALDAGILLNATSDETLRFLPPLTVSPEEIDRVGDFLVTLLVPTRIPGGAA
ncbi:MAG TPA: aminotransferase class III-fold pyridoxal phosphate-dependent enzyme, partial [Thermoleophilia bacterium]|nr:aminotransferase class III-fold pyridoxal phosphate-dependent enzyme [Thermoleophilia bacterium]